MNGYQIHDLNSIAIIATCLCCIPALGLVIARVRLHAWAARLFAWILVCGSVILVERLSSGEPAGIRMIALIVALLWSMKSVVAVELRLEKQKCLGLIQWFVFVVCWPGMRPAPFEKLRGPALDEAMSIALTGIVRMTGGAILIIVARLIYDEQHYSWTNFLAIGLILIGISLFVHFGVFNVLCGGLRGVGVNCKPLFRAPILSTSLGEFWGKRWNLAFSEMTAIGVYRPLQHGSGKTVAMFAAFVFSGLLHELAISVPVRVGYGLPLLYFSIHAVAMTVERKLESSRSAIWESTAVRRFWTVAWVLCPIPILFHPAFIEGCVLPLLTEF